MLSVYAKLSAIYTLSELEKVAAHMQGTVFTLAREKKNSTIKNLSHIQCQCVDELSSLV